MDEVSKALPELVWLENLSFSGTNLTLVGQAMDENAVANYIANLDASPYFSEPTLVDMTRASKDAFKFNLKCVVQPDSRAHARGRNPGARPRGPEGEGGAEPWRSTSTRSPGGCRSSSAWSSAAALYWAANAYIFKDLQQADREHQREHRRSSSGRSRRGGRPQRDLPRLEEDIQKLELELDRLRNDPADQAGDATT